MTSAYYSTGVHLHVCSFSRSYISPEHIFLSNSQKMKCMQIPGGSRWSQKSLWKVTTPTRSFKICFIEFYILIPVSCLIIFVSCYTRVYCECSSLFASRFPEYISMLTHLRQMADIMRNQTLKL